MKKANLKLVATNEQPTVIEQLSKKGFAVNQIGEDTFVVVSNATGATVERNASAKDLETYLTCMSYINERHGAEIQAFKYKKSAHA